MCIGGFNILCLIRLNESLVLREDGERERMGNGERTGEDGGKGNGRSGLWYRLVFQPVLKEVIGTE